VIEYKRLGDIATVIMGQSPKGHTYNNENVGKPLINGPTEFGTSFPNVSLFTTDSKRECEKGDLIFCVRGSTTGRMNWADQNYSLGRGVCSFRGENLLATRFIRYALEVNLHGLLQLAGGGTFPNLTKDTINDFRIPFPKAYTKYALIANEYDNLIENNNRRIAILEEMAQSLYREWFVYFRYPGHANEPDGSSDNKDSKPNLIDSPLGPIPEGWEVGKLESASSMKYGKMSKKELRCEEGIPIYSGYKITGYYPEANLNESKVIVVARGVGGTGDVKMSPDICWLTNLSIYIMENENILKKAYLFYQLKFSNLRSLDSGTSISQITIADLSKYKIIIPPIQIQQSFEAICCTFWSQIKVLSKQNENLKKQRDMLLPKLISGQIQLKD